MSISAEEKNHYLREAAIVLAREGFHTDRTHAGGLRVLLDGAPLCEVTENGGITYRIEDFDEPERIDAKDKVYEIVRTTAEYMRQMETAPFLKADGLEDGYKVLADFNDIVLAGIQSKYGVQFVTWDWSFDRKGVSHGHYYTGLYSSGNYEAAKRDFATRSGLIPEQQLFREKQLIEIYRCCTDTLQGSFELSYDQEKTIQDVRKQIEECLPDIMERIQQQDTEPTQEQTMYYQMVRAGVLAIRFRSFFHFREEFTYAALFHARHAAAGVGAVDDVSARSKAPRRWDIPQPISLHARRCGV